MERTPNHTDIGYLLGAQQRFFELLDLRGIVVYQGQSRMKLLATVFRRLRIGRDKRLQPRLGPAGVMRELICNFEHRVGVGCQQAVDQRSCLEPAVRGVSPDADQRD